MQREIAAKTLCFVAIYLIIKNSSEALIQIYGGKRHGNWDS
jgi:hypothetical protein